VKLTLTSEEVAPNGDGDSIGRPVQMQIANAADFAGAQWQTYAPRINWTLAPNGGTKTVYVKYRDAKGRTALANDSITVGATTLPTSAPTRALPTNSPTRVTPPSARVTMPPMEKPSEVPSLTPPPAPTETPTAPSDASERATATPAPPTESREPSFDGLGAIVVAIMSIVLIRVWYSVER
jgi:hypothetical protein